MISTCVCVFVGFFIIQTNIKIIFHSLCYQKKIFSRSIINQEFLVCWILCPDLWKQNTFTLSEIRMECVEFIQKVQRYQQRIESDSRKKKGRGNPNTSPSPNPKGKGKIGDFRLGLSLILWKNSKVTLIHFFSSVQFSYSVLSDSLRPHGLQHSRLPCPSPAPRVDSKSLSR